jgi:hypothetical protein
MMRAGASDDAMAGIERDNPALKGVLPMIGRGGDL